MMAEIKVTVRGYRTVSFTAAVVSAGLVIGAVHIVRPVAHRAHGVLVPNGVKVVILNVQGGPRWDQGGTKVEPRWVLTQVVRSARC